jgi:hypothetical protein
MAPTNLKYLRFGQLGIAVTDAASAGLNWWRMRCPSALACVPVIIGVRAVVYVIRVDASRNVAVVECEVYRPTSVI